MSKEQWRKKLEDLLGPPNPEFANYKKFQSTFVEDGYRIWHITNYAPNSFEALKAIYDQTKHMEFLFTKRLFEK